MFKPTASYRMTKQSKRFLATVIDPHKRGEIKRTLVQAELAALIQPKISKNRKEKPSE